MSAPAFYLFGVTADSDGRPRATWHTDSAELFQYVAEHSHHAAAVDVSPSPMPLCITCSGAEAEIIGEHLDAAGALCVGLIGMCGYAILRTTNVHVQRVVVGTEAMAEWLHESLGDHYHTHPSETVRSSSGRFGWTFATDDAGAFIVADLLDRLGATRVSP